MPKTQNFTLTDNETTSWQQLTITATSTNTSLLPVANIQYSNAGASPAVTVTAVAGNSGSASVTLAVSDGVLTSTGLFTVTVNPLPVAAPHSYTTDAGVTFSTTAANGLLTGAIGVNLTAAIATNPAYGTLSNVNAATGAFTYTPANNTYSGTDTFTYTVSDGYATSAPATVTMTLNPPPSAASHSYTTDAGTALNVTAANGLLLGATGVNLSAAIASAPTHGTLSNVNAATGAFTYTPANNSYTGADTFTYTVTDGLLTLAPATVTITLKPLPTAAAQSYTTDAGIALTATAVNGLLTGATGMNLTAAITSSPAYGTLSNVNAATGAFTYTPSNNTYTGADNFAFTVSDGIGTTAPVAVTITINPFPSVQNQPYTVVAGGTLAVDAPGLLAGASGVHLTVTIGDAPLHGVITELDAATGAFTYTPGAGYSGTDSFTYAATDGYATSAPATVTITVYSVPVANPDSYTVVAGNVLTVNAAGGVLANDTNADGNPLTAALVSTTSHGTLSLNANGSFSYHPAAGFSGTDSFTYTAGDSYATSSPATVTITVYSVPVANPDSYTVVSGNTLTVNAVNGVLANDTDADGGTLSAVLGTGVSHGNLTLNPDGSFTYTPAAGYSGTDSFSYAATDGHATSAPATVSMTVYSVPVANPDSYTVVSGNTLTVNAVNGVLANDTDADGGTLSAVLGTGVGHGNLTLNPDGSFTYTPAAGYSGTDSFSYAATDGHATSAPATVSITVVIPAPAITSFTPPAGITGTLVTVSGVYFTGATEVDLDGTPEPFTVLNDTTITFTVTDDADTGQITVTTPYGSTTSDDFFLDYQVPIIVWFAPNTGGSGTVVTLSGFYFTGSTVVTFGGVPATSITVVNDSTIYATVGNGASGAITVTNPAGTSDPVDTFTFIPAPTITSFTTTSGGDGTAVTIIGTHFTGATAVSFGGTTAQSFSVVNDDTIEATVGSGATGQITVVTPGGRPSAPRPSPTCPRRLSTRSRRLPASPGHW